LKGKFTPAASLNVLGNRQVEADLRALVLDNGNHRGKVSIRARGSRTRVLTFNDVAENILEKLTFGVVVADKQAVLDQSSRLLTQAATLFRVGLTHGVFVNAVPIATHVDHEASLASYGLSGQREDLFGEHRTLPGVYPILQSLTISERCYNYPV
jgi:hypothetical protein